jgi:hypothetical protein
MKPNRYGAAAAVALIAFLVVSNVAYVGLINLFGYDDVLREPVDVVLARFQAGGPALRWRMSSGSWFTASAFLASIWPCSWCWRP